MYFVTGATGFIGRALVNSLVRDGVPVCALSRNREGCSSFPAAVNVQVGDVTRHVTLPAGVSTIFHCAGVISAKDRMREVNVIGTKRVVEAALAGNARLIHLSSAGVIGTSAAKQIDEQTPCNPHNLYEQTKLDAELIVMNAISHGLKAQILRPTIVFGPGKSPEKDSFFQLIRAIAMGRYKNIGSGEGIYNLVHVDEVVNAMRLIDSDLIPNGRIYFINSEITFNNLAQLVTNECCGFAGRIPSIPAAIAFSAALSFTLFGALTGRKMPLTLSRYRALTNEIKFNQSQLEQVVHYKPLASLEEYVKLFCRHVCINKAIN